MKERNRLLDKLVQYGETDFYPFHMPGHKRQSGKGFSQGFPNPFSIDITEIEGFDNLHEPEGILKESMEEAARIYGADRTYYLVNGSTCGILSAVCGTVAHGGKLLMGRNCHKSAYNGAVLNRLETRYIYPQVIGEFGIQGGYLPEDVENMLKKEPDIQAVLLVSPTYEGIVSDIGRIAGIVHGYGVPLIVDEAHGAHLTFGKDAGMPVSALDMGADVVIQSLHKTLPAFTQCAVLHVKRGYADLDRIDRYVHLFQSSSPSYVLMAGIENCIFWMDGYGRTELEAASRRLAGYRKRLEGMKRLRLLPGSVAGTAGVFAVDEMKVVVSCRDTGITGPQLMDCLRERYHLEMEMCGVDYITAIVTAADTEEGIGRLTEALLAIDGSLEENVGECGFLFVAAGEDEFPPAAVDECGFPSAVREKTVDGSAVYVEKFGKLSQTGGKPVAAMTLADAMDSPYREVLWKESAGMVCGEFVYAYPPGIPIAAPGEVLTAETVELVLDYRRKGLPIQGMADETGEMVRTVAAIWPDGR